MPFEKVEFEFPTGEEEDIDTVEVDIEKSSFVPVDADKTADAEQEVELPADEEEEEDEEEDVELEIVDDTPEPDRGRTPSPPPDELTDEEMASYGKKVRNRIKGFNKGYHDERRAKEEAKRESEELKRLADKLLAENKNLKLTVTKNHSALLEQAKASVSGDLEKAREKYRTAHADGDTDALLEAQEALTEARLISQRLDALEEGALQTETDEVQQETTNASQERQTRVPPDPRAVEWQKANSWFGTAENEPETAYALGIHKRLVENGVPPDSNEYYEQLNASMHATFPALFADADDRQEVLKPKRTNKSVVAPATRSTTPKKYRLTQTQVQLAKRLGLTNTQYAIQAAIDQRKENGS